MNKLITLFFLLFPFLIIAQAVHTTCNGSRYLNADFQQVDTIRDVFFGVNTTYSGQIDSLRMDLYIPQGDTASERPLFIMAFGGSFVLGEREDMAPVCHYFAQKGFVAVTIDYRLFTGPFIPFPDSVIFSDVAVKAFGDMKAAIRFFREDAATSNTYKIDPDFVFVGGGSSGAITALNVAYLDSNDVIPPHIQTAIDSNGGFEGNTTSNYQYSTEVSGVINFSGALGSASWMDAGDAPVFSVHDDQDNIVPYAQGYGEILSTPIAYLEGSSVIADTATALGIHNILITIPNSTGHVTYVEDPLWQDSVFEGASKFFYDILCPGLTANQPIIPETISASFYPNPTEVDMIIHINDLPASYTLTLYDKRGRLVYVEKNIFDEKHVLNGHSFPEGMYFLAIDFDSPKLKPVRTKVVFR